jgi:hypothetical protein
LMLCFVLWAFCCCFLSIKIYVCTWVVLLFVNISRPTLWWEIYFSNGWHQYIICIVEFCTICFLWPSLLGYICSLNFANVSWMRLMNTNHKKDNNLWWGACVLWSCIYALELEIINSNFERSICLIACQPQMCNDQYEEKCLSHQLSTWTLHLHNFMAFIPRMSLKKLFLIQHKLVLEKHCTWDLID